MTANAPNEGICIYCLDRRLTGPDEFCCSAQEENAERVRLMTIHSDFDDALRIKTTGTVNRVAEHLAWWWRQTQSESSDDPRNEASWWDQAARIAVKAERND